MKELQTRRQRIDYARNTAERRRQAKYIGAGSFTSTEKKRELDDSVKFNRRLLYFIAGLFFLTGLFFIFF
ncbi:MAG: hypothetical protein J6W81_10150 [Lentisphaeria bacterium]|nr:hypothetical protein [Lentisphaeria bacterium]